MMIPKFLAACVVATACASAFAQASFPERPVRIIVPWAAGGGADVQARLLQNRLAERLKQPVVVENRPGAGSNIGNVAVVQAPADGYTLLLTTVATVVNPHLWSKAGYARSNYSGVALLSSSPLLIVAHPSFPPNDLKQVVKYVKDNPGKVPYASGGAGAITQIEMELFKQSAGIEMQHIGYQGQAPAVAAVVGGQVPLMADSVASALPQVKGQRLKALAITSHQRSPLAPEIATVVEQGFPELANAAWYGLVAPAGTPAQRLKILSDAARDVLAQPEMKEALAKVGAEATFMDPAAFDRFIDQEEAKWSQVVKKAGIKLD
jgi:tripartite-type tricarboxylate transporter receptor subunit TctC